MTCQISAKRFRPERGRANTPAVPIRPEAVNCPWADADTRAHGALTTARVGPSTAAATANATQTSMCASLGSSALTAASKPDIAVDRLDVTPALAYRQAYPNH